MTSEKRIVADTLIDLSAEPETMVWRNNTGSAWQGQQRKAIVGQMIRVEPGMVILAEARPVKFGLEGSGDILGASSGHPLMVECKTETGRQSDVQRACERAWVRAGGIYILARNGVQARDSLRKICIK